MDDTRSRPTGSPRFREKAEYLGVKYGTAENPQAGMGAAIADINQDGRLDIFKTNFSPGLQQHVHAAAPAERRPCTSSDQGLTAMGQAVFYDLSWGCGWYDFDNDRDLDLYVANGHVYKEVDQQPEIGSTYDMFNALFECRGPRRCSGYREIGRKAVDRLGPTGRSSTRATAWTSRPARAARCFADLNNDGRMDVLVTNMNAAAQLIVNDSPPGPDASLGEDRACASPASTATRSARRVEVTAGGVVQRFPVIRGTSFLGSDDPRLHVGLGSATTFDVKVDVAGRRARHDHLHGPRRGPAPRARPQSGKAESRPRDVRVPRRAAQRAATHDGRVRVLGACGQIPCTWKRRPPLVAHAHTARRDCPKPPESRRPRAPMTGFRWPLPLRTGSMSP